MSDFPILLRPFQQMDLNQQHQSGACSFRTAYDLEGIITAAASLRERIMYGVYGPDPADEPAASETRWRIWLEKSSQGNKAKFDRRLSWDALDATAARRTLALDPIALDPAPFWAPLVSEMLAFLASSLPAGADSLDDEGLVWTPFAQVMAPLAQFGMGLLENRQRAFRAGPVAAGLRTDLVERLSSICCLTLGEEYLRFRLERGWSPGEGETSRALYREFVEQTGPQGLVGLFSKYPVLPRLVATAIIHWVAEMETFLSRMEGDAPEIARRFFDGRALPPVRSVLNSFSDPHRKGRTVKIVVYEDGRKIVYKPRSLAIDVAWRELTLWLRERDGSLDAHAPVAWNCGEYGWIEFIKHSPCQDLDEVRDFYRRAGMLTCLFYALRGTDFHEENLIAAGAHPVPIDLETLLVPNVTLMREDNAATKFPGTVLQSLMLPYWRTSPDRKTSYDISGLGSMRQPEDSASGLRWVHINTDAMQLTTAPLKAAEASHNLPTLPDRPVEPGEFVTELIEGFDRCYRALLRYRAELQAENGPLERSRKCFTRVIFRATRIYATMLGRSLTPRLLTNGLDRSLEFEGLSRQMLAISEDSERERVFRAEVEALEQLDIPYFDAETDSTAIRCGDGCDMRGLISQAGFDAVISGLRRLDAVDLDYQVGLIRSSFAARSMALPSRPDFHRDSVCSVEPLEPAELISRAEVVGEQIIARAIWDGDAARWIGLDYTHATGRYSLQPIGASLYSGRGGIALFLAALHRIGGDEKYRQAALGAARSIWRDWSRAGMDDEVTSTLARAEGIGGCTGMASLVYSLAAAGKLLGDASLTDDAMRFSNLITAQTIDADRHFDVISGSAGAILGLLPLWKETAEPAVLDRIERCGAHLIKHQEKSNGWAGGWMTDHHRPLTGFAHGAAGIAYALLRAYEAVGEPAFRAAADDALHFERAVFLPTENTWPDFRLGSDGAGKGWCSGAPGIGLARLGCLSHDRNNEALCDLETAIHWMQTNPAHNADHLCCGELGNLEVLLSAGSRLNRADWVAEARRRGASVIARSDQRENGRRIGFQANVGPCESIFTPGLFDGMAGVGYQMLRLAAPDRVPCVLLWE